MIVIKSCTMNDLNTPLVVFIFRRDLRIQDNTALSLLAHEFPDAVLLPVFIFNPKQIDPKRNPYYSAHAVKFMIECLEELHRNVQGLCAFYGDDEKVIKSILQQFPRIQAVAWNQDITAYAKERDLCITQLCQKHGKRVIVNRDDLPEYTLYPPPLLTASGTPYEVFTPFYKRCLTSLPSPRIPMKHIMPFVGVFNTQGLRMKNQVDIKAFMPKNMINDIHGGREAALAILKRISNKEFAHYDKERDIPHNPKTTRLSAYMKFGCVSCREVYDECVKAYGINHGLVRELIWREFYAHIAIEHPQIMQQTNNTANHALKKRYNLLQWRGEDAMGWHEWCEGRTGFPLVDAAMRCMNATGWMHNRLRMVVASFLTKDLRIDWRLGERYFASRLTDFDPASNSGGWQWVAGVGADAQPYYRIFNPWLQSKKYDPECLFIKQWLPALSDIANTDIHEWHASHIKYPSITQRLYPKPIVDHAKAAKGTLAWYKKHL